jgi:hippurate hydrolase
VIPDEVVLQLTVRSFTTPVRQQLLASIERVVKAEAAAAGATKMPTIERIPTADALVNDAALTQRVSAALVRGLGSANAVPGEAEMVSEDFSVFQLAGVPSLQLRVGAVEPRRFAAAMKSGETLPSLHSSGFAPDLEPTMKASIMAEVIALRELMPAR